MGETERSGQNRAKTSIFRQKRGKTSKLRKNGQTKPNPKTGQKTGKQNQTLAKRKVSPNFGLGLPSPGLILDKEDLLSSTEMQFVVTGVRKVLDGVMTGVG